MTLWKDACPLGDVPVDDVKEVECDGHEVALFLVDGVVFATDSICTHGHARLCDGYLEGYEIECPLHQGRFDIRTGKALCAPLTEDIRTYPVRVEHGRVLLAIEDRV